MPDFLSLEFVIGFVVVIVIFRLTSMSNSLKKISENQEKQNENPEE